MGQFIEHVAPYIKNISLKGNPLTAVGLGEIGAGLERAGLRRLNITIPGETDMEKELYTGTRAIALQQLSLEACQID